MDANEKSNQDVVRCFEQLFRDISRICARVRHHREELKEVVIDEIDREFYTETIGA